MRFFKMSLLMDTGVNRISSIRVRFFSEYRRGLEPVAVGFCKLGYTLLKLFPTKRIDILKDPARMSRKSNSHDRADVSIANYI